MIERAEGSETSNMVAAFAGAMTHLAEQSEDVGNRPVAVTARDAAEALLALLDVLEHGRRTVALRTV